MLTYLIQTTERLALMALCLSVVYAYSSKRWKKNEFQSNYLSHIAVGIGFLLSAIMTYYKLNTAKVDTSIWNLRNHVATIIIFIIFIIFTVVKKKKEKIGLIGEQVSLIAMTALILLYYLPYVLEMPYIITRTEESMFSTNFMVRMIGIITGIILTIVLAVSVYKGLISTKNKEGVFYKVFYMVISVNIAKYVGLIIGTLLTRRLVESNHVLFTISMWTTNYAEWFIHIALIICLCMQIRNIICSYTQKELYKNPAERRKIIAKWNKRRKNAIITIICIVITVSILTIIKEYDSREVELTPIEETKQDEVNMYVNFDQVNDGMLHRFGYTAENGTVIRFIVIQKPNSSAYGIGLDACEICGETGYYQKGDMVVCNLCDVVMNINTIGFKGGCNPIVIDYSIEDGNIIVPIEGLLEHIDEFK